jgi:hypothetical protein
MRCEFGMGCGWTPLGNRIRWVTGASLVVSSLICSIILLAKDTDCTCAHGFVSEEDVLDHVKCVGSDGVLLSMLRSSIFLSACIFSRCMHMHASRMLTCHDSHPSKLRHAQMTLALSLEEFRKACFESAVCASTLYLDCQT